MALIWDVKQNVNAYREISREEYEMSDRSIFALPRFEENGKFYEMTTECNMLIYLLGVTIGIPELTTENWEKVYNRIHICEISNGGSFLVRQNPKTKEVEAYNFTKEMVWNNVGIKTNGSFLSSSQFKNKIASQMIGDLEV
jgi:hypothetical protein